MATAEQKATVANYTRQLSDWQWLYGPRLPFSFSCEARFDWGSISLQLQVEAGIIRTAQVYSDAMDWEIADDVTKALTDCRFACKDMQQTLEDKLGKTQACSDLCRLLAAQNI